MKTSLATFLAVFVPLFYTFSTMPLLHAETPRISLTPKSLNFGNVKTEGTSEKTITIKNTGTSDLVISDIAITGSNASELSQTNECTTIPAADSCTITATFTPIPPFGKKSATISISSNDPKKPILNVKISAKSFGCTYSISASGQYFEAPGGTGSVSVSRSGTTPNGCNWTATNNNPDWITITSGGSGNGNGNVTYSVAMNTGNGQRTGTLTIAGQTFTVSQSAAQSCSYSISRTSQSFEAAGGPGSVGVTAGSGCSWTATNNNPNWITITSGSSGNGDGNVTYSAAAYTGTGQRTGTLTIAGQTFTVTQDSIPQIQLIILRDLRLARYVAP